jgi:hypothetical protein
VIKEVATIGIWWYQSRDDEMASQNHIRGLSPYPGHLGNHFAPP